MSRVFICHSSADAVTAREICASLETAGIPCWIAPRDPLPGIPYGAQLVHAIASARLVLLVFSAHANESRPVLNELELAANRGKIVLPVRIEDVQPSANLEFYIRSVHWFDAVTQTLADALAQLVRDVQTLVVDGAVPADGAAASPAPAKPSNLPPQLTSFVGRERDVAEIEELVRTNRIVTLVGSGGAGKTRAAVHCAVELSTRFPDGTWFVELAPIADGALVAASTARVVGLHESLDKSPLDILVEYLKDRDALLVLDNCEHVIGAVRGMAAALTRGCAKVRILATSRESLNIGGERIFRLPSLAVPQAGDALTAEAALRYGAIRLFADRALAADGQFAVTDANAPYVAEICRRLDGIPLAIELAAARVKVLSPVQLARRLDERFRLLTSGDRSALPRHQTMRALIDWSYDLLTERERELFRNVAVFADGFSLAGACAVYAGDGDEFSVLELLASLVDKSLVQSDGASEARYRLLESTRQYAGEKLATAGEIDACARRHLEYLQVAFKRAGDDYEATTSSATIVNLAVELEDARSALDWGERHAVAQATDLFIATRLWPLLGLYREGIERARRLIALTSEDDPYRLAGLWRTIAHSAVRLGHNTTARDASEHAIRYARACGDPQMIADCLMPYADVIAHARRFDEADAALDEAEKLGTPTPRRRLQALQVRGVIASLRGDLDVMARCSAEVRKLYASLGNDAGVVSAAINLAEAEYARGATNNAIEILAAEIPRAERLPSRSDWAFMMRNLAAYLHAVDDVRGARDAASKALVFYAAEDAGGPFTAIALEQLTLCLAIDGSTQTAAMLEGYVQNTLARLGFEREYTECTSHRRLWDILRANIQAGELDELIALGEQMQPHEALAAVDQVAERAAT